MNTRIQEIKQRCELEIHTYPWRTVDAMRLLEDRDWLLDYIEKMEKALDLIDEALAKRSKQENGYKDDFTVAYYCELVGIE